MKAPARLAGAPPRVPSDAERAAHRRWMQRLSRAGGVMLAALLVWGAMAVLNRAEGDLRQVRAPSSASNTAFS